MVDSLLVTDAVFSDSHGTSLHQHTDHFLVPPPHSAGWRHSGLVPGAQDSLARPCFYCDERRGFRAVAASTALGPHQGHCTPTLRHFQHNDTTAQRSTTAIGLG